jgi:hypothetical protein
MHQGNSGVYREEVDRNELRYMIGEERFPCLRWRFGMLHRASRDTIARAAFVARVRTAELLGGKDGNSGGRREI